MVSMSETAVIETSAPSPLAVVVWAGVTNLAVTVILAAAGLASGSASMLSEAAHSFVDTSTEALMVAGNWHARRWSTARYFWGLLAAVDMFAAGGLYALYNGYAATTNPQPVDSSIWWALAVLAVTFGLELSSWARATRSLVTERDDGRSWLIVLRTSTNIEAQTVVREDTADLTGRVLAAVGLILRLVTGSAVWDGVMSVVIGIMLLGMAYELGAKSIKLLRQ